MIEVNDLSFRYSGTDKPAVSGLSFTVQDGEIFGFLGPNGAGKSTTQKILIRLLSNYQGEVHALGRNLSSWSSDYYERIGVSFEFPNHFLKLTAAENLRYFAALYSGNITEPQELLDMVGLGSEADVPVGQFSKGMKNRLNIARSLLHNPQLLFLDEPTAGLDPVSARRIKEIILGQQKAGKTIFLTTHDMTVADDLCNRVAFIVDGHIKIIESPRELKLEHGIRRVRVETHDDGALTSSEFPLDGIGANSGFIDLLKQSNLETIHTLEATLDDVFIKVTGRSLE